MSTLQTNLDSELVNQEFPHLAEELYLNTGSSGRKPVRVLRAMEKGLEALNINPTIATFIDETPWQAARQAVSKLLEIPERNLMLCQNTTQGLQLIMQSLLLNEGDELITTDQEHGSLRVIARYLEETRGVVIRTHPVNPQEGSAALTEGILKLFTGRTRLIALSEIFSYSGWRPNLLELARGAETAGIPLLADGAHVAGQVACRAKDFPLWVGSGHKWLGGPSGTGFAYVAPHLMPLMKPVWLGDWYYERLEADSEGLQKFEAQGTSDITRWLGLAAACELQFELGADRILDRSWELVCCLREKLTPLAPIYRTPDLEFTTPDPALAPGTTAPGAPAPGAPAPGAPALGAPALGAPALGATAPGATALGAKSIGAKSIGAKSIGNKQFNAPVLTRTDFDARTAMLAFRFENVETADLRKQLWESHKIWIQPDFAGQNAGHGMRVSCHYSLTESDIDRFIAALKAVLK